MNKLDTFSNLYNQLKGHSGAQELLNSLININQHIDLYQFTGMDTCNSLNNAKAHLKKDCEDMKIDPNSHLIKIAKLEGELSFYLGAKKRTKNLKEGFDSCNKLPQVHKYLRINDLVGGVNLEALHDFPNIDKLFLRIRTWKNPKDLTAFLHSFTKLKKFGFEIQTEDPDTIAALKNYLDEARGLDTLEIFSHPQVFAMPPNLSHIKRIELQDGRPSSHDFLTLISLKNVTDLELNIEYEYDHEKLIPLLANNSSLTSLSLYKYKYPGYALSALKTHPTLRELRIMKTDVWYQNFNNELCEFLKTNTKLEVLKISRSYNLPRPTLDPLSQQQTQDLADAIATNHSLRELFMGKFIIAPEDWPILKEGLKKNKNLKRFVAPELFGVDNHDFCCCLPKPDSEIKDLILDNITLRYLGLPLGLDKQTILGDLKNRQPSIVLFDTEPYTRRDGIKILVEYKKTDRVQLNFM